MKKHLGKITGIIATLTLSATFLAPPHDAHASSVTPYPYNGLYNWNYNKAMQLKSTTGHISINHIKNPKKAGYEAVGRVSNYNGWKGKGKDSMGTGFIIDDHTFMTNLHVVQDSHGKIANSKYIKLVTERNGSHKGHTFKASKIKKVPDADAVLIHTKTNMRKYAKPLKFESESKIENMKKGTNIKVPGYDKYNKYGPTEDNTKLWESHAKFLKDTSNNKEIMNKQIFRSGGSGSPMLTKNNKLIGISAYGWNLNGTTGNELAGGFKFTHDVRHFIQKNMK